MPAQMPSANDVVTFLKAQHQQIKDLMTQVAESSGPPREDAFISLRRLLAVHETAEEEIVHPRVRRESQDGDPVVVARLNEELAAKEALAELEALDRDSSEFDEKFARFRADVMSHAEAEERDEFVRLADKLDDDQLARMRRAVALAERLAPTRPHPGVELAGQNFMVGPFVAMLDRARDLITGKH